MKIEKMPISMRHSWIVVVVGVVGLLWLPSTRSYFKHEYPMLLWTALFTLLATFWGVNRAFELENKRQLQAEADLFSHSLIALLYETAADLRSIEDIRQGFTTEGVSIKHLRSDIAEHILGDALVYKLGGRGLFEALWAMVDAIDTYNRYSDVARQHFEQTGRNTEKMLSDIFGALDQAEYRIRVLQKVLDRYNVERFQTIVWKEPDYEEIKQLIVGRKDFRAELNKMRSASSPKNSVKTE